MKGLVILLSSLFTLIGKSQVVSWTSQNSNCYLRYDSSIWDFSEQICLSDSLAGESVIHFPVILNELSEFECSFWISLDFKPSSSNNCIITCLKQGQDSVWLEIGESGSDDRLYLYSSNQESPLFKGKIGAVSEYPELSFSLKVSNDSMIINTYYHHLNQHEEAKFLFEHSNLNTEQVFSFYPIYTKSNTNGFCFDSIQIFPAYQPDSPINIHFEQVQASTFLLQTNREIRVINQSDNLQPISSKTGLFLIDHTTSSKTQLECTIQDNFGNNIQLDTVLEKTHDFQDLIIISEFLNDQDEFYFSQTDWIELANYGDDSVLILNYLFKVDEDSVLFPPVWIPGNSTLVVTGKEVEFGHYIKGFPQLKQSNTTFQLKNELGQLLDSIHFHMDWKSIPSQLNSQGRSFERRFKPPSCSGKDNFKICQSTLGSSPGQHKWESKIPDPLSIEFQIDSRNLSVTSSQALFFDSVQMYNSKEHQLPIQFKQPNNFEVELDINKESEVRISGLQNCFQTLSDTILHYIIPIEDRNHEIQLSEIMFNPTVHSVDWMEIYNTGENFLDLSSYKLFEHSLGYNDTLDRVDLPKFIIEPKGYYILAKSKHLLEQQFNWCNTGNIVEVDLPDIPNSGGRIEMKNRFTETSFILDVSESLHASHIQDSDGISLARLSFERPFSEPSNWTSSIVSSDQHTACKPNFSFSKKKTECSLERSIISTDEHLEVQHYSTQNSSFTYSILSEFGALILPKIGVSSGQGEVRFIPSLFNQEWDSLESGKYYIQIREQEHLICTLPFVLKR